MKTLVLFPIGIFLLIVVGTAESSPLETNQWWVTKTCNGYCYKYDHYGCANCCVGGRILNTYGANKGKYGKCDEKQRCLCDTIGIKRDSKYSGSSSNNYYDQKGSASSSSNNYYGHGGSQSSNFGGQQSNNFGGQQQGNRFGQQQSNNFGQRQPLNSLSYYDDEA